MAMKKRIKTLGGVGRGGGGPNLIHIEEDRYAIYAL